MADLDKVPLSGPANVPQGSKLKNFVLDMMSDPGLSPMGLGVVAGSAGANAAVDALSSQAPKDAMDAALMYARMKYPTLMKKVLPLTTTLDRNQLGAWSPYPKVVGKILKLAGANETGPMLLNKLPSNALSENPTPLDYLSEKIDTIGHELTHGAIQATRTPEMLSNYIQPDADFAGYLNQPAEVNANRGGATAQKTFLNFLAQYPQLHKFFGIGQ
jgi:hypothetical protein